MATPCPAGENILASRQQVRRETSEEGAALHRQATGEARGERFCARELEVANEKLRSANRELEEFAYVASHDLREPLRMVNIFSELLIQHCAQPDDKEASNFARQIQDGVARMDQLIQGVLQYSQITHDGGECTISSVALREPLESALHLYRDRLNSAGARVDIGDLPTVAADRLQMELVFQNLISNSLKYAHPDRRPCLLIYGQSKNGRCTTYFSDNGVGFEPDFGERIFGLFQRLHGRDVPGTGLGLAICRRIVERYGGEIHANGKPQQGATFVITLKGLSRDGVNLANSACRGQSR